MEVGGLRAEVLLALLSVRVNAAVSTDALIDELWTGHPPDGAATTLRSYVSRLRSALGPAASIQRLTGGYVLEVPAEAIDVTRFEALARAGRELRQRGRQRRAASNLASALQLWRGEAFAGLPLDGLLGAEAARLQELRLNVLEERIEADLELRPSSMLIHELESLLIEHPFRERLWHHLLLALYRAGRQADALAAYHRARSALAEELGIEPGPELQALEAAILRQDVPGPAGERSRPMASPPLPLTSFVGRLAELDAIRKLLARSRLVTLVGLGGVGKTRLAIEAATRARVDLVDAVAFVDLAAVTDSALVAEQAFAAVGVEAEPGEKPGMAVGRQLAGTDVILILDNCEHVRDAVAALASELLQAAPDLRILATSREVLGLDGEATYAVTPLQLPSGEAGERAMRESDAVRLFIDRATLQRHDLPLDDEAYAAAVRICLDLDGLPLAIELAAARTKTLSLGEVADRIQDRFGFLVSSRRLAPPRHRTLREVMDWSFELLGADEQLLLTKLSVFPAGARLHSIAAVCLDGDQPAAERLVERLVDASLLLPVRSDRGTRYRLLETVRQYAEERLAGADRDSLRRRHAEHTRFIAESTRLSLEGTGSAMSFELAREEVASIRAAIQWATEADPSLAAEIACSLERFWSTNQLHEGIAVFTRLLAEGTLGETLRARALRCRGGCRYISGDFLAGVEDYAAALAIHRRLGQHAYEAHLLVRLAVEARRVGNAAEAAALLDEAARIGGTARFPADSYVSLGLEADLASDDGRVDDALALLRQAAALAGEAMDDWWRSDTLQRLAERALTSGRIAVAGPAARESLRWSQSIGDRQATIYGIAWLAWEAAASGHHDRAGRLWGGLQAEVDRGGPVGQWELEQESLRIHVDNGSEPFRIGVAAGRSWPLDRVVQEALIQD